MTRERSRDLVIRLRNDGLVTAYVGLIPGVFDQEVTLIDDAIRDLGQSEEGRVLSHDASHLLGHADLMLRMRVSDFRIASELRYPTDSSAVLNANWVFSVPYVSSPASLEGDHLRFVIHVRVSRAGYASGTGAERDLVRRLRKSFNRPGLVSSEIHVGLGWSDLIIDGTFKCPIRELLDSVVRLHETPPVARGRVQRTLSLIGYSSRDGRLPTLLGDARPVIQVRAAPGRLAEALDAMEAQLGSERWGLYLSYGEWDLIALPEQSMEVAGFLASHRGLLDAGGAESSGSSDGGPVERVKTQLILPNARPTLDAVAHDGGGANHGRHASCRCQAACAKLSRDLLESLDRSSALLPRELRREVSYVQLLLQSAIRDSTSCCDVIAAVEALESACIRLLQELESQAMRATGATSSKERLHASATAHERRREIRQWCMVAERILNQRVAGSFKDFLRTSDRTVVQRGGVQKVLFLADAVMNEFLSLVRTDVDDIAPTLTSLYSSISTIGSFRTTGIVLVPVRHAFTLPIALPDLWHEAGSFLFFSKYSWLEEGDPTDSGIEPEWPRHEVRDMADHYGDLCAFVFGFGQDLRHFAASLIMPFLESFQYQSGTASEREGHENQLLSRLRYVAEFAVREKVGKLTRELPSLLPSEEEACVEQARGALDWILGSPRYETGQRVPESAILLLRSNAGAAATSSFRRFYMDFLSPSKPATPSADVVGSLLAGEVVDLPDGTPVTSFYRVFYELLTRDALGREPKVARFRAQAALARSALIAFTRRQILRQTGRDQEKEPPPGAPPVRRPTARSTA